MLYDFSWFAELSEQEQELISGILDASNAHSGVLESLCEEHCSQSSAFGKKSEEFQQRYMVCFPLISWFLRIIPFTYTRKRLANTFLCLCIYSGLWTKRFYSSSIWWFRNPLERNHRVASSDANGGSPGGIPRKQFFRVIWVEGSQAVS